MDEDAVTTTTKAETEDGTPDKHKHKPIKRRGGEYHSVMRAPTFSAPVELINTPTKPNTSSEIV